MKKTFFLVFTIFFSFLGLQNLQACDSIQNAINDAIHQNKYAYFYFNASVPINNPSSNKVDFRAASTSGYVSNKAIFSLLQDTQIKVANCYSLKYICTITSPYELTISAIPSGSVGPFNICGQGKICTNAPVLEFIVSGSSSQTTAIVEVIMVAIPFTDPKGGC